jgi:hypothetical protein
MPARCDYPHERESEPLWRRSREPEPEGLWQGGRELRMPLGQRLRTCRQKGAGASPLPRKLLRAIVARLLGRKPEGRATS